MTRSHGRTHFLAPVNSVYWKYHNVLNTASSFCMFDVGKMKRITYTAACDSMHSKTVYPHAIIQMCVYPHPRYHSRECEKLSEKVLHAMFGIGFLRDAA